MGALELLVGLVVIGLGVADTVAHPPTQAFDNRQLVLLAGGFVGLVIGCETLRSAAAGERHRPSWPGPGAAILAGLVGLVFAFILMSVSVSLYVPNPSGSSAYEYCPPVFEQADHRQLPAQYEAPCEEARSRRTRVLAGLLLVSGLLPVGVGVALRRQGRSTAVR